MCLYNNFVIDYAKTLFMPQIPEEIARIMAKYSRMKTPYFFQYAKQKTISQVESQNTSCVNRLRNIVPAQRFQFNASRLGKFDYKKLMSNPKTNINCDLAQDIIDNFFRLSKEVGFKINKQDDEHSNFEYIFGLIKSEIDKLCSDRRYTVDVLVKQLFHIRQSKRKSMFWGCYGDVVLDNLKHNLARTIMCEGCGKRIKRSSNNKNKYCEICSKEQNKLKSLEKYYNNKKIFDLQKPSKPA